VGEKTDEAKEDRQQDEQGREESQADGKGEAKAIQGRSHGEELAAPDLLRENLHGRPE
jgi:hypothetical protein